MQRKRNVISSLEEIAGLFMSAGMQEYAGEVVTVSQHMLQAGALAVQAGAEDHLIAAALLHDVGHVLPGGVPHEDVGAEWLSHFFPEPVYQPVRLHVPAKRYLCATDPTYLAKLSPASLASLEVQGGPMSTSEVTEFERAAYAKAAIQVRRWDDAAKDPTWHGPEFDWFKPPLERLLQSPGGI